MNNDPAADAMREYLTASMRDLNARQGRPNITHSSKDQPELAIENLPEVAELSEREAQERALQKQVKAEWRASLTPAQKLLDTLRDLRWLGAAWLLVSVPLAAGCAIYGAAIGGSTGHTAGAASLAYLLAIAASARFAEARANRVPDGHIDRVREQLERVQSTLAS